MSRIIKAELYKILHSPAPWGIAAGYFILVSILVPDHSGDVSFFRSSLYPIPFMIFMQIALALSMIGNEFDQRMLQGYVASGNKRFHIFLGKLLVYLLISTGMIVVTLLIHSLYGLITRGEAIPFGTILFLLPSFVGICMIPAFLAFVFKDIGRTLGSGLIFYLIMIVSLNNASISDKSVYLPFGHSLLAYKDILPSDLSGLLMIDAVWIIVLLTGSFLAFRRSDLK